MFFGITFSDYPDDIAKALERANAWYRRNIIDQTFHIKSGNKIEPLTEAEKERIANYLYLRGFKMEVVFDD